MGLNQSDIDAVCFGILCNFSRICGEAKAKEAAGIVRSLQAENDQLKGDVMMLSACVYYKPGGLCSYGGDDPANICVLGPCDHDISRQEVLTELERRGEILSNGSD